jgi:hypothetical protein
VLEPPKSTSLVPTFTKTKVLVAYQIIPETGNLQVNGDTGNDYEQESFLGFSAV